MPAAVHCSPPGWVCLPSREFSKVSITLQNCFIFHTGFAPCLPYYDFLPLFKSENIFTHILRQLDRCLASALFKSRVHHNQNNTMINYPDIFVFLFFLYYIRKASMAVLQSPALPLCGRGKIQPENAVSGVYTGASAGDRRQRAVRQGSSALGWSCAEDEGTLPHASTQLLLVLWMARNHH